MNADEPDRIEEQWIRDGRATQLPAALLRRLPESPAYAHVIEKSARAWVGSNHRERTEVMMTIQKAQSEILSRLDQVIRAWPRGWRGGTQAPVALQSLITSDFDLLDLLHDVSGVVELSQVDIREDRAIIEFLDKGGSPERATFINVGSTEWRLQSLKFQCAVCFGSGENEGEVCIVCNGVGWGAE